MDLLEDGVARANSFSLSSCYLEDSRDLVLKAEEHGKYHHNCATSVNTYPGYV